MIKCLNCGSTAQVRIIEQKTFTLHERHIDTVYKCQCGCGKQFAFYEERIVGLFKNDWAGYENYIKERQEKEKYRQKLEEGRKRK